MASEQERPIEKLLREAAQKRRDQAPASFEPHPATRRMLQGEVARQYPQENRTVRSGLSWLWRISPKLIWAVASVAVLAITVWLLRPGSSSKSQERLFAQNEPTPIKAPAVSTERRLQSPVASEERLAAAATPAETQPSLAHEQPSIGPSGGTPSTAATRYGLSSAALAKKTEPGIRADFAQGGTSELNIATAPALPWAMPEKKTKSEISSTDAGSAFADKSLASAPVPGLAQSKDNAPTANLISGLPSANQPTPYAATAAARQIPSAPAPSATPPENAPASTIAGGLQFQLATNSLPSGVALAQHFVRSIPAAKTVAAQSARTVDQRLLVSFQVEQNGPELRVRDEDGSVYFGYLQLAQPGAVLRDTAKAVPATAGRTANLQLTDAAAYSESASLRPQTYFFRVAGTNQTLKLPVVFTGSISNAPGSGLSPTLSAAKISGRVRVGAQREFEVLALPR